MLRLKSLVTGLLIFAAACSATASEDYGEYQSVIGSKHDLAANPAVSGPDNACAFCHELDGATKEVQASLNRRGAASQIVLYDNERLRTSVEALADVSSLCMTCHDGETPLDAIGGAEGSSGNNMNTLYSGSTAIIGTDLGIHHPVGVANPIGIYFNDPSDIAQSGLRLFDGKVECLTCHDVHGAAGAGKFLVKDNRTSALCLDCHNK